MSKTNKPERNLNVKKEKIFQNIALIIIFISMFIFTIYRNVLYIDETWTLNICLNIKNGLVPYKDFSLLVPPLYYYLLSIPLLFTNHIIGMRIMVSILNCISIYYFLKILKELKFNPAEQTLYTIIYSIMIMMQSISYNALIQILLVIGIYFTISKNTKYQNIKIALIISAMILTKHTTGIIIGFFLFISYILLNKPKKKEIVNLIISCISLAILFIIYLLINDCFLSFFDYTLFGISNFTNNFSIINFIKKEPFISLEYFAILSFLIILSIIKYKKTKDKILIVLNLLMLSNLIVLYPIANKIHLILTVPTIFILALYIIKLFNIRFKNEKKSYIRLITLTGIYIAFIIIMKTSFETGIKLESNAYNGLYIDEKIYNAYSEMIQYIQENPNNDYYSIEDCYVFISLETNKIVSGNYTLYLNGNMGTNDPIDIINEVKDNSIFYIYDDDENGFWQTPTQSREYIRNNFEYIGHVKNFDLYKK